MPKTNAFTHRLAIFASGAGSNAQQIINYFKGRNEVNIALIVCNKPNAGVVTIAANENISLLIIEKETFFRGNAYLDELRKHNISFIVLAGFLWKIPQLLIHAFPNKMVNIHPALLPKYGGKGMYGHFAHESVLANHENESGITIHYVNENFDEGNHIFQTTCPVLADDTPDSLAARIHILEHKYFPAVIERVLIDMED